MQRLYQDQFRRRSSARIAAPYLHSHCTARLKADLTPRTCIRVGEKLDEQKTRTNKSERDRNLETGPLFVGSHHLLEFKRRALSCPAKLHHLHNLASSSIRTRMSVLQLQLLLPLPSLGLLLSWRPTCSNNPAEQFSCRAVLTSLSSVGQPGSLLSAAFSRPVCCCRRRERESPQDVSPAFIAISIEVSRCPGHPTRLLDKPARPGTA